MMESARCARGKSPFVMQTRQGVGEVIVAFLNYDDF